MSRQGAEAGVGATRGADYDVVVIGGGVLGTAVAARLSLTTARVALVEAERDVGEHASKGNAGVAVSYYGAPGLQQTSLIARSYPRWERLCARLDVPYRRIGALMIALTPTEEDHLRSTYDEIRACGVRAELLPADRVRRIEPLVTPDCRLGIHLPDEGIIDPMRLTVAYAVLAATNGATIHRGERVTAITHGAAGSEIVTERRHLSARFVVNAAGLAAGAISALAGGEPLTCWPRKGQYVVLDRSFGERLTTIVFSTHGADTKGCNVVPTVHGSVLLGPTADDHRDGDDRSTDPATIAAILDSARRLVPGTADARAIKTFAANRPASDEAHRVRIDAEVANLVHVTDRSAGVSISPAAADLALDLLRAAGLDATERAEARDRLLPVPRLHHAPDPAALIEGDPLYGQVVCACEHVSAAEIRRSLEGPVPAVSMDGVRKRTGAGYGRCQGSLCLAGVAFLTAMATGTGPADVLQTARGTVAR